MGNIPHLMLQTTPPEFFCSNASHMFGDCLCTGCDFLNWESSYSLASMDVYLCAIESKV